MYLLFCMLLYTLAIPVSGLQAQPADSGDHEGRVRKLVENRLAERYPSARFEVSVKWIPDELKNLPASDILSVEYAGRNRIPRGYELFRAEVKDKKHLSSNDLRIQLYIKLMVRQPVASARISSGDVITGMQVHLAWVDVTRENLEDFLDPAEIQGLVARSLIREGEPLTRRNTRATPIVHAGDPVTLLYNPGPVLIRLECVARQDGAAGDEIRIYSRETGKTYLGKVADASTATWTSTL